MFTPNQQQAAREMMRVCRPGGKIGLANWTPQGFVGRLFKIIGKYVPWRQALSRRCYGGDRANLEELFGSKGTVAAETRTYMMRYKLPEHWIDVFRTYYGPMVKTFAAIDAEAREALEADLHALIDEFNPAAPLDE